MSEAYEKARDRALANPMTPNDPRHGTVNGYANQRCRCDECKYAWSVEAKMRRQRRSTRLISGEASPDHGRSNTYTNWLCRCRLCTDAHAIERREKKRT